MIGREIKKIHNGNFIHRYDITYETTEGNEKVYEMISRNPDIQNFEELRSHEPDAVVMILHDKTGERILLNKEFRLAIGDWIYNFPAGLIEPGESPVESGKRELKEETGLDLIEVSDTLSLSYSAVGFSNESNICLVGIADGQFQKSNSDVEEIQAGWYTKEEVRELLKDGMFAARTQAYCYLWSKA